MLRRPVQFVKIRGIGTPSARVFVGKLILINAVTRSICVTGQMQRFDPELRRSVIVPRSVMSIIDLEESWELLAV